MFNVEFVGRIEFGFVFFMLITLSLLKCILYAFLQVLCIKEMACWRYSNVFSVYSNQR